VLCPSTHRLNNPSEEPYFLAHRRERDAETLGRIEHYELKAADAAGRRATTGRAAAGGGSLYSGWKTDQHGPSVGLSLSGHGVGLMDFQSVLCVTMTLDQGVLGGVERVKAAERLHPPPP
jgi:hypothetical protein